MYFFAEDRELAWLTLAAGCPYYHLCLWKWLGVSLHNAVNQQNMENLTNRWHSKVTAPYSIGIEFTVWTLTLGERLRVQTKPCSHRIQDGPGFGQAWNSRSGVSLQWAPTLATAVIQVTSEHPPAKTQSTRLKEGRTTGVSPVSCLKS